MQLKLNPYFTSASGKLDPSHDNVNMVYTVNGKTFSRKVCNPRNIEKSPYTQNELKVQNLFKQAAAQVKATLQDNSLRQSAIKAFKAQTKYSTLRGYLLAKAYNELKNA